MSLINDALKKAQHMQARGTPGFPAPTPAPAPTTVTPVVAMPVAAPAARSSFRSAAIGGITALALGGIAYGVYFFAFASSSTPTVVAHTAAPAPAVTVAPPAPVAPAAPAPQAPPPEPVAAAPDPAPIAPPPAPVEIAHVATPLPPPPRPVRASAPTAPAPEVATAPVQPVAEEPIGFSLQPTASEPAVEAAPSEAPLTASVTPATDNGTMLIEINSAAEGRLEAPPPVAAAGADASKPDSAIQAWVEKIRVIGVRSGPQPKVLMNDHVYAEEEIVNYDFNLRLKKIGEHLLEFADPAGNAYFCRY